MKVTKHDTLARFQGKAVVIVTSEKDNVQIRYMCGWQDTFWVKFCDLTAF